MSNKSENRLLLVGDNPFLNISHLSQKKARERTENPGDPDFAASLLSLALENGANGFTFSVCESNLAILERLNIDGLQKGVGLYPVVPYAFEYVQKATQNGGISGLFKTLGWDMVRTGNSGSLVNGVLTALTANPVSLMKAYVGYELTRLEPYLSEKVQIGSVMLHQLVTDIALALEMDWLFKEYVKYLLKRNITPGFNTGNFAYLVDRFTEWGIDLKDVLILAPFNKVGFQMMPTIQACEAALKKVPVPNVIAISVLASGFVSPRVAAEYISSLPNIKGLALGISKVAHAKETFQII